MARWFFLIQEVFHGKDTLGLTWLRFVLGGADGTLGPLALSKLRLKLDLAVVETHDHAPPKGEQPGQIALP